MKICDAFRRPAKLFPNNLAIIDRDKKLTFSEFMERVHRLVTGLLSLGLCKGDRIGVLLKNRSEYFEIIGAGVLTGIVVVPINYRFGGKELEFILRDSGCRALILEPEYSSVISAIRSGLDMLQHCICVDASEPEMVGYESLISHPPMPSPAKDLLEDDLAMIMYTSGTTGTPKGAMFTQRIMGERCLLSAIEMSISNHDRYLNVLPFFHIGVQVSLGYLYMGAANFILGDWDVWAFCETVQNQRITATVLAPSIINFIIHYADVERYDLKSLKLIFYGASPISESTLRSALKLFRCDFTQGLGSTENFTSIILRPEEHVLEGAEKETRRLQAAGRESVLMEARVVNAGDEHVIPGEVGEVITRGGCNFSGYWNNPKATREALKNGWYYSGDLGTVDEDGYIFLVERKKEVIISGAENIYPREIENILFSHPAILEAAVIGIPHEKWGETPKAIIVLKPGEELSEEGVIEFCKAHLSSYKKPTSVEFVNSLPKNPQGKIMKRALKEKYWTGFGRKIN